MSAWGPKTTELSVTGANTGAVLVVLSLPLSSENVSTEALGPVPPHATQCGGVLTLALQFCVRMMSPCLPRVPGLATIHEGLKTCW